MTALDAGSTGEVRVQTEQGEVKAAMAILATNARAGELIPYFADKVDPVRGQMLTTAPCDPMFTCPIYANHGYDYWRQDEHNRVVLGGWRNLDPEGEVGHDETVRDDIQAKMVEFLAEMGVTAPVTHRWAGIMGFSRDGRWWVRFPEAPPHSRESASPATASASPSSPDARWRHRSSRASTASARTSIRAALPEPKSSAPPATRPQPVTSSPWRDGDGDWDATETAQRIAAGDVSAVEVMEAAIQRTEAWNPKLNALTHFDPEGARAEAKAPRPGVFAGVPTFVKDLEDLAGVPTGCGTAAFSPVQPSEAPTPWRSS